MNNTTVDTCQHSDNYGRAVAATEVTSYLVLTPIQIVFGLSIHIVALVALYRQSKTESPYVYQAMLMVGETLETVFRILYCIAFFWCDKFIETCARDVVIRWYAAYLSCPLMGAFVTVRLLLAVGMALDRFVGVAYTMKYQKLNHKLYQGLTLTLSLGLGLTTSIYDCWTQQMVWNSEKNRYDVIANQKFLMSSFAGGCASFRTAIRAAALIVLILLNAGIVYAYRAHTKKSTALTDKVAMKAKSKEKAVLFLCLSQSVLTFISGMATIGYKLAEVFIPHFYPCMADLVLPIFDGIKLLIGTVEVYAVLATSAHYRNMLKRIACLGCAKGNEVKSISIATTKVVQKK